MPVWLDAPRPPRPPPPPPPPPSAMRGSVVQRMLRDLFAGDAQLRRIPVDRKSRAVIAEASRLAHRRGDAVDFGDAVRDGLHPLRPRLVFLLVVALHPHLDRGQQPENLLFADLHGAAVAVVRRARNPRGLQQVLAAENQPGALRSAQALAAAVARRTWSRAADRYSERSASRPRRP